MISRMKTFVMDKISWWLVIDFLAIISISYGVASDESKQRKEKTSSGASEGESSSSSEEQNEYPSSPDSMVPVQSANLGTLSPYYREMKDWTQRELQQKHLDLAFIVDASGRIGSEHFQEQLRFLKTFMSYMPIEEGKVRMSIVVFGTEAGVEFALSCFNTRQEILDKISAIKYDKSGTNIAAALRLTRTYVFTEQQGDRGNASNVAILITDGSPNEKTSNTTLEAKKLINSGVRIIALAIRVAPEVFDTIVSAPISDNIIAIDNYSQLDTVHSSLISLLCNGVRESKTNSKNSTEKQVIRPTFPSQSKPEETSISKNTNSETETTASNIPTNTTKSANKQATPQTSSSESQSERTTISATPNSETETTALTTPANAKKSTNKQATTQTSSSKSQSERTTISATPNSETETTILTSPANAKESTNKQATPPLSSQFKSERTTISTRLTSGTESILPTTSTPTPATTVNTRGSSSTLSGLLSASDIITSTISATLKRCYERCENPVGATSTLRRAINSLRLDKKAFSKHRREKTTASDDRQSAANVASVVLAIALTPILCLVIWDLIDLFCNRQASIYHCKVTANTCNL